jgi:S1-C subfamily serine protease
MSATDSTRMARQIRRAAPALLTLASMAILSAGPAIATASSAGVSLADWNSNPYTQGPSDPGGSSGGGQWSDPWGGGTGSGGTGTGGPAGSGSSQAATVAESQGVALIDTVLSYQNAAAAGTGIVLSADGKVLTNYHVVEGSTSIKVTIASTGQTYTATVLGHDQTDDVALLQLKDASNLTTAKINTDAVRQGDQVTAVGNAGGTDSLTAASGTITGLDQSITTQAEGSAAAESLHGLIENDANVQAGDSGGPLYDSQGEVIGIDTAGSNGPTVDSYAIPIGNALSVVSQIQSGQETSTVQIGASAFLGVEVASAGSSQDGAAFPGSGSDPNASGVAGATVSDVVSGGPAASAGLQAGDTITAIDGTQIGSADQISAVMSQHNPGDSVDLSWIDSSGSSHSATVTLGDSPVN